MLWAWWMTWIPHSVFPFFNRWHRFISDSHSLFSFADLCIYNTTMSMVLRINSPPFKSLFCCLVFGWRLRGELYISTNIFLYFIFSFDECLRGNLKMQTIAVCFPFYLKAKASGVNTSLQGELWSPKKPYPEKQVHPHRCDCQCQK